MRILLFLTFIYFLSGCTTIEIAKEVNKASQSIKTSVQKITKADKKILEVSNEDEPDSAIIKTIEKEKEIIETEKKKERKLVKEQKKLVTINFIGKTLDELSLLLGDPQLIRLDANVTTARFDSNKCRLFLYFNNDINTPRVEHFEIRDDKGNLINIKKKIHECYKDFKLT